MSAEEEDAVQTELADLEKQLVSLTRRTEFVTMLRKRYRVWSRTKQFAYQMHHGLNFPKLETQVRSAQLVFHDN
jgi:hypothetical protein